MARIGKIFYTSIFNTDVCVYLHHSTILTMNPNEGKWHVYMDATCCPESILERAPYKKRSCMVIFLQPHRYFGRVNDFRDMTRECVVLLRTAENKAMSIDRPLKHTFNEYVDIWCQLEDLPDDSLLGRQKRRTVQSVHVVDDYAKFSLKSVKVGH